MNDGAKILTTVNHPQGSSGMAWFKVKGDKLYPTMHHPQGSSGMAWFKVRS